MPFFSFKIESVNQNKFKIFVCMALTKSVIKRKYKIHIPIFLILLFFLSKIISHSDSQLCSLNRNLIKDMEDNVCCLA